MSSPIGEAHWQMVTPDLFELEGLGFKAALRWHSIPGRWTLTMPGFDPQHLYGTGGAEKYEALHILVERFEAAAKGSVSALEAEESR